MAQKRPESGPMAFGEDWTGIFLRGDDAGPMGMILRQFVDAVERGEKPKPLDAGILRSLAEQLSECDEHRGRTESLQLLLPFEECLMTRATVICPPPV